MIDAALRQTIARARLQRSVAWLLAIVACSFAAWRIAEQFGVAPQIVALAAAVIAASIAALLFRDRPITTATAIEHFNRAIPSLEESAALLNRDPSTLSALEHLQHARAATAWSVQKRVPSLPLPSAVSALMLAATALLLGVLIPAIPRRVSNGASSSTYSPSAVTTAIGQVQLHWAPPAYTGGASRDAETLEASVESGSMVTWRIAAPGATAVRVVTAAGDTLTTMHDPTGPWTGSSDVGKGWVWHVEARSVAGQWIRGEEHLLRVIPDREPVVAILAPEGRVELEWREPHVVVVRAVARDDYGLAQLRLAATVAKGRGEGVKFKENFLPVEIESRVGRSELVASRIVHLDSLGIEPGDEVFLAFEATDNRAPSPQRARSETIFLSLRDTLEANTATLNGLAMKVEPAYFRSQRQIILDTEALLSDVRAGKVADGGFARALEIGMDQHLLRLRYGAMVGEETNEKVEPDQDFTERHEHDMADNTTLLSPTVKALLKTALAAMWDAERELRTGKPKPALPAEYRALAALEETRRAERAYVKRIGFEPKPVDVVRTRLSRKAERLAPLDRSDSGTTAVTEPLLRDALAALEAPATISAKGSFDAAARRLAERALDSEPARHLETLRALRRLIDGNCTSCREVARRGLLAALPPAPKPLRPARSATGALAPTPQ
ncbi:MAG: DUF4175 family protein [Gemmatimonadales bacterium]